MDARLKEQKVKQADECYKQENYEKAAVLYGEAFQLGSAASLVNRGICFACMQQWDQALADYRRALVLASDHPALQKQIDRIYYNLNLLYLDQIYHTPTLEDEKKHYAEALRVLESAPHPDTSTSIHYLKFMSLLTDEPSLSTSFKTIPKATKSESKPASTSQVLKTKTKEELQDLLKNSSPTEKIFFETFIHLRNNNIPKVWENLIFLLTNINFMDRLRKKDHTNLLITSAFFKLLTHPLITINTPLPMRDLTSYSIKTLKDNFITALGLINEPLRHRAMLSALMRNTPAGTLLYMSRTTHSPSITSGRLKKIIGLLMKDQDQLIIDPHTRNLLSKDISLCNQLGKYYPSLYQSLFKKAPAAKFKPDFFQLATVKYDRKEPSADGCINQTGEGNRFINKGML